VASGAVARLHFARFNRMTRKSADTSGKPECTLGAY
jgi:hypothetical protein